MALFGSMMPGGLNDDPFFGGPPSMMSQMDHMMSSMMRGPFGHDPFFNQVAAPPPFPALTAGHRSRSSGALAPHRPAQVFPGFGMPGMDLISSMGQMNQGGGNCHSFSSSSVMTMTTGPDGRPQVYQATSSTRGAPGGVKEVKRTESDSRTGIRKMAIGHHIQDRAHVIEKEHSKEGEVEEREEFVNLDEDEAPNFNAEFQRKVQQGGATPALEYRPRHRHNNDSLGPHRALPGVSSAGYRRRNRPMLAVTTGSSPQDRPRRWHRDEERGNRGTHRYHPNV